MTPKEKAKELVDKFIKTNGNAFFAKECALIAVDEMMDVYASAMVAMGIDKDVAELTPSPYLLKVKQELESL